MLLLVGSQWTHRTPVGLMLAEARVIRDLSSKEYLDGKKILRETAALDLHRDTGTGAYI